jgi:trimethylamine--corrinoid protein Co-methyltransferase
MKQPEEMVGRRSRRRPGSADVSHAIFDRTRPYRHLRNPFEPMKVFSDDQVAAIHEAALVMLETQGMKVLSADARVLYRNAGADVDEATQMVRLGRELVGASLATAPRDITLHAVTRSATCPCRINASHSRPPRVLRTSWIRRAAGARERSRTSAT